ncbi:hypothetical protein POVCU2_0013800 [Plasmodium ovale curtisi]|uniref:PIR Superfamily Protein n=1 Tax=Plasmodium ovale curtisi TaxID=864141 RepID=A0A1A8VQY2_PLAOA|nr:hypothetical protein POVCU2_0013800 [Plasmodium ovale curtisi]
MNPVLEGFKIYKDKQSGCKVVNTELYCELINKVKILNKDNVVQLTCLSVMDDQAYSQKQREYLQKKLANLSKQEHSKLNAMNSSGPTGIHGSPNANSPSSMVTLGIILPLFRILLISFILCKFTPFSFLLYYRLIKNKVLRSNEDEREKVIDDMLDNTYEKYNINSPNSTHQMVITIYEIYNNKTKRKINYIYTLCKMLLKRGNIYRIFLTY